jgi:hypothetical protein
MHLIQYAYWKWRQRDHGLEQRAQAAITDANIGNARDACVAVDPVGGICPGTPAYLSSPNVAVDPVGGICPGTPAYLSSPNARVP